MAYRTIRLSSAIFGIGVDREGFKIKTMNGTFEELDFEVLQKYFQFPQGINIAKDSTIYEVIRLRTRNNEYYFIFKKYVFYGFENINSARPCYYACALLFEFNYFLPSEKELFSCLEHISKMAERVFVLGEAPNIQIISLEPRYETSKVYKQSDKDKKGVVKIVDDAEPTILNLIRNSFMDEYYSDYRRLFFTSSEDVIRNSKKQVDKLNWKDEKSSSVELHKTVSSNTEGSGDLKNEDKKDSIKLSKTGNSDQQATNENNDSINNDEKNDLTSIDAETNKQDDLLKMNAPIPIIPMKEDDVPPTTPYSPNSSNDEKIEEDAEEEIKNKSKLTWITRAFWAIGILATLFSLHFIFSDSQSSSNSQNQNVKHLKTINDLNIKIKQGDSIRLIQNKIIDSLEKKIDSLQMNLTSSNIEANVEGEEQYAKYEKIYYDVKEGEGIHRIATMYRITKEELIARNPKDIILQDNGEYTIRSKARLFIKTKKINK